jgi:hypothetical protein
MTEMRLKHGVKMGQPRTHGPFLPGWMVSEKLSGVGLSVLQPDWSMILNLIIQWENSRKF